MNTIIRKTIPDDLPGIVKLLFEIDELHNDSRPDIFKAHSSKYTLDELGELLCNEKYTLISAIDQNSDNSVIGYLICISQEIKETVMLLPRKIFYIDDFCVSKVCQHNNIGTQLFEFAKEYAKSNNFDSVELNVWEFKGNARKFYEKCGMTMQKSTMEYKL